MLKQRVLTALVLAPPVLAAIYYLPATVISALVAVIMLLSLRELAVLAGATTRYAQAATIIVGAILITALWLLPGTHLWVLNIAAVLWLVSLLWLSRPNLGREREGTWRLIKLGLGVLITVPAWLAISRLHAIHPGWVFALFFLVWGADVGAYVAGKTLGRRKLAPTISPGKTWEGLVGGVVVAVVLMLLAAILSGQLAGKTADVILKTLAIAIISVGGDLIVSLLKRHAGSKDTGHLLPGHGGLMDRIDSLCAAAPFFALAAEWWRNSL